MEHNPILIREVRARWRRSLTFLTVLGYALALAAVASLIYADHAGQKWAITPGNEGRATAAGHLLFVHLTWIQAVLWMVLAALLTAPAIAGERERGSLQAVQLSTLSAAEILRGKLLSTLSFVGVLLLVPLPMAALCFQLGGVSPVEFVLGSLMQVGAAAVGASAGLLVSACNKRSGPPLVMVVGGGLALVCLAASSGVEITSTLAARFSFIAVACLLGAGLLTRMCLALAREVLAASLPEVEPWEPYPRPPAAAGLSGSFSHSSSSISTTPPEDRAAASGWQEMSSSLGAADRDAAGHWAEVSWELPLIRRLHFSNPIVQREVRVRLRSLSTLLRMGTDDATAAIVVYTAILLFWTIFFLILRYDSIETPWWGISSLWLTAVAIGAAVMGASSFTREREQDMLESLLLSPMTPRQVLGGKLGAPLVMCSLCSVLVLPALPPLLWDVAPPQILALAIMLTASACFCTVWGMCFSWFCRHTAIAAGGAVVSLVTAVICAFTVVGYLLHSTPLGAALWRWPLYHTVLPLLNPAAPYGLLIDAVVLAVMLAAASGGLLALLHVALRPATLEKEARSVLFMDLTQISR